MILQLTEHKVYYVRDHLRLFTWSYECLLACYSEQTFCSVTHGDLQFKRNTSLSHSDEILNSK
jgi:hypothetical protein